MFQRRRIKKNAPTDTSPNNPPKENNKEEVPSKKETKYKDVTKGKSLPNVKTDVSRRQFEEELKKGGWKHSKSQDGRADNYEKDGSRYSVRDNAKSTDGPTADYYKPGSDRADIKIRFPD